MASDREAAGLDDEPGSPEIQSVARVGSVIALFGPLTPELTAAYVAEKTGLNRTTAYRYCISLVSAGLLERGRGRGTFRPGDLALKLGLVALGRRQVVDLAPPYLERLAEATHITAVLSLWGQLGPIVASVQEYSHRTLIVTVNPGTQLDLTAAQTRVFLAFRDDEHAVSRFAAALSEPQRTKLADELEKIRAAGVCVAVQEGGFVNAAAPVFDRHGICATIALIGTGSAADLGEGSNQRARLLAAAEALSRKVGGEHLLAQRLWL